MMEPVLHAFTTKVRKARLNPPQVPYVSNVTGKWITAQEATDPNYWAAHLRQTVRFADGLEELAQGQKGILLEIGPGQTLSTLARQHPAAGARHTVLSSLGSAREKPLDQAHLLNALGRLWLAGVPVNWAGFYAQERRQRLPLPTYPFERKRYWVEPVQIGPDNSSVRQNGSIQRGKKSRNRENAIRHDTARPARGRNALGAEGGLPGIVRRGPFARQRLGDLS